MMMMVQNAEIERKMQAKMRHAIEIPRSSPASPTSITRAAMDTTTDSIKVDSRPIEVNMV